MKNNQLLKAAIILFAGIATYSCDFNEPSSDSKIVSLSVSSEQGRETKSSKSGIMYDTIELSDGDLSLYMNGYESVNNTRAFSSPMTKGSIMDAESISEFPISMIRYNGDTYASGTAKPDGNHWSIFRDGIKVDWPNDAEENGITYDFFAYVGGNSNIASVSNTGHKITYKGEKTGANATNLSDLLVAYTGNVNHDHEKQNEVMIHFYHVLAAIRFTVDLEANSGITVKKIQINGVYPDGTVTYNTSAGNDYEKVFSWELSGEKVSYCQTSFDNKKLDPFFIVPQGLTDVTVTYLIEKGGVEYSLTTKNLGTTKWDAGKIYHYTLSNTPNGTVGIKVVDEMDIDRTTKSNVFVLNDKTSAVYIRAAVVGNWFNASNKVVASLDESTISFKYSNDWIKADDGFFYYAYPVIGHEKTKNLIDEFKNNITVPSDAVNLHLEIKIASQAVEYDSKKEGVNKAWGMVQYQGASIVSHLYTL